MSGAAVAYHLRQNKAVDRHLFIDLLSRLNRYTPIGLYKYISFGGAFLEDFKLIHSYFGNKKMVSLENDSTAFRRQSFNVPLSCIECLEKDSKDFVDEFESNENTIVWLDYADAGKTRIQIQEFETLVTKMAKNDIIKLTLNANPDSLYKYTAVRGQPRETVEVQNQTRLQRLTEKLGDYLPNGTGPDDMTMEKLPEVLIKVVEYAANKAMTGRMVENLFFQPLSSFAYVDGYHQMLTVSGVILSKADKREFLEKTDIRKWGAASLTWGSYKKIMVPALTAREKVFIDQLLPKKSTSAIHKKLKFYFDPDISKSNEMVDNYRLYYRYYPNFHRVLF